MSKEDMIQGLKDKGVKESDIALLGDNEELIEKRAKDEGVIADTGRPETPVAFRATMPIDGTTIEMNWSADNTNIPYFGINNMSNNQFSEIYDLDAWMKGIQANSEVGQQAIQMMPERFRQTALNVNEETLQRFEQGSQTEALQPTNRTEQIQPTKRVEEFQPTAKVDQIQPTQRIDQVQQTAPINVNTRQQQQGGLKVTQPKKQSLHMADQRNRGSLRIAGVPRLPIG